MEFISVKLLKPNGKPHKCNCLEPETTSCSKLKRPICNYNLLIKVLKCWKLRSKQHRKTSEWPTTVLNKDIFSKVMCWQCKCAQPKPRINCPTRKAA